MASLQKLRIRCVRYGCANRNFMHIVLIGKRKGQHEEPIEQLGVHDPMPNERNEILTTFNFERVKYWLGQGVDVSENVGHLLGLAGFYPIHPRTYMRAWRNRARAREEKEKAAT